MDSKGTVTFHKKTSPFLGMNSGMMQIIRAALRAALTYNIPN